MVEAHGIRHTRRAASQTSAIQETLCSVASSRSTPEPGAPFEVTEDANGNPRYIYKDIDPVYDSDDSDAPNPGNTIGDIPLSFYDSYPHIGYDINGRKIMRPAKGAALDALLDSIEVPKGWTGLTDPATGKPLQLTEEELDVLKRLTRNEAPEDGYDPYPDMVEYFSGKLEQMPLSAAPEPKRRFIPSKHEAKRVMKIVKAIREGRIQPYRPPEDIEDEDFDVKRYDIWHDETPRADHVMNIPAPKLPPPGYEESYHPPPEYIPDEAELKAWLEQDEEDRERDFLPRDHGALRKTPGYERFVKDRFERSLDLYLAPRVRRSKLNIDPESLLPKLPSPEELRPFPSHVDAILRGHQGRVRSLAFHPRGEYIASGGDDGTVRVWYTPSGYQLWQARISDQDPVSAVQWRPGTDALVLSCAAGENVFLIAPKLPIFSPFSTLDDQVDPITASRDLLNAGWQARSSSPTPNASNGLTGATTKEATATWARPPLKLQAQGVLIQLTLKTAVKVISWHRRGDYFATVSPAGQSNSVAIHTLSKHMTQLPFRRLKGLAQSCQFHPTRPIFFVATQRMIRSYDLSRQELLKTLQPGARWISSFDVHPGGDNLIVGSYDKRLLWMDLDLSTRPYKTLRYHPRAIRAVRFHHGGYPLFADASDDGSLQIFHGKVVGDLMENASIVPLKVLRGHKVEGGLGVLDVDWHPQEPWCASAGADGTVRVWIP
ncbi:hypothetical protein FH972_022063 [Carpinus fangiana]|uniref:Ribosome biogenesis protein BOP1 homolog n=1 Tax=Carpinus fangiana TaxID=176857 RepID=A0A5N6KRI0_9ROSI|nr:hypothetical protein FH972_022063 [Carpinus fangiana]